MVKYELQNIIPFNDIYYVDCFHLSFFTAWKYFCGSVFSYIVNDYFVYKLEKTANGLLLKIDNLGAIELLEVAKHNGLQIEYVNDCDNHIIDSIIDTIIKGSIAIIPIDGYFYRHPYHSLFYLKEHHHQVLLIFGFDCEKKVFKIVDANGFEWNTKKCCYKHEISFQELVKCYEGITNSEQNIPKLIKISKDNINVVMNDDPHFYKSIMINNMKLHKTDILKGLQNICTLSDNISQFDIDKTTVFNNKVASLSNQYKILSVIGSEYNNASLLKEIINCWVVIEALIYKNDLKVIDKKKYSSKLGQLFKLESMLYEDLFSLFEKIT